MPKERQKGRAGEKAELHRADRKAAAKQEALSNFRASLAAGKATGGARGGLKLVGEE